MNSSVPTWLVSWLKEHPYLGMIAGLAALILLVWMMIQFYRIKPGGKVDSWW